MRKPKIVFIGAGSMSFGVPTLRDIFTNRDLAGARLCLVDIDTENLERMYSLACRMNEVSGHGIKISKTTQRRDELAGADFVISSLAIERCDLWKHDFEVPKKYGVRHTLGENGGPGALYFTMRTLPLVLDIARDMEELCPQAWFLNFSNPESRLVLGVSRYTSIKCIGLCHGIYMARDSIAKILGRERGSIDISAAGMNHFQWVTDVRDTDGADLYPELRVAERSYDPAFLPYSRKLFRAFGLFPTCSDDHLGEYQAYGYEAGEEGYNFKGDADDRVRMKREISQLIGGHSDAAAWLKPSGEHAVDAVVSIFFNRRRTLPAAIVQNGGAIPKLPPDVAVEVPVMLDGGGIHKTVTHDLPEGVIGMLSMQVAAQRLSVLAAAEGSKEIALQALLCDPVIQSTGAAEKINDELFEINKKYIRKCV